MCMAPGRAYAGPPLDRLSDPVIHAHGLRPAQAMGAWFDLVAHPGSYADAGGMKDIARSASAVMVSAGFTPGLAEMAEPSITYSPS